MRKLLVLIFLLPLAALAQEVTVAVCRRGAVYQFSYTGDVESWSFEGAQTYDLDAMTASGEGVKFTVYFGGTSISAYGYPDVAPCAEAEGWQPGAPSILIPAPGPGPYTLEIWDGWHWWLVTDNDHPAGIVLYNHAGYVELIGSAGQDVDPAHYRLLEVAP